MFCRPRNLHLRDRPLSGRLTAMRRPRGAWIGALVRDRRGMSAVEFGLAAPIFLAALSPVIDIGLAFSHQIRVNQAVEAGAQYASMNPYNPTNWSSNVSSAITNATTMSVSPNVGAQTCAAPIPPARQSSPPQPPTQCRPAARKTAARPAPTGLNPAITSRSARPRPTLR